MNRKKCNSKTIIMTGGGTGGHVYPALPVIRELKEKGYEIRWIGSRGGMEEKIVRNWDIGYCGISTGKLRRYFSLKNFTDLFRIAGGFFQSLSYLRREKPLLVFSKGGFVSVPPVLAAAVLKIPVLTHDSDVDPGLATRINSRFARRIFVAYEKSLAYYSSRFRSRTVVSGNPVRKELYQSGQELPPEWTSLIGTRKVIVVIGGSQGARILNELIQAVLPELSEKYFIIHQMGEKLFVPSDREHYLPLPYIDKELPALFRRADLAVSRAGAGTLWELAAAGTPSVLIPLAAGSRGDQIKNASIFSEAGISAVLDEKTASGPELLKTIEEILDHPESLKRMKQAAGEFTDKRAEDIILPYIEKERDLCTGQ